VPIRTISDGVLDQIALYSAAPPAASCVGLRLFTASDADLGTGRGDGKTERQSEAKIIQTTGPQLLADALMAKLRELGPYTKVDIVTSVETKPSCEVNLEGRFAEINPGSRAKRYFVGFGAGKSELAVAGSVFDSMGNLLAKFTQRRIGVMGMGGGDSLGKLTSDTRAIGEDLAKFLSVWAKQGKLDD